MRRHRPPTHPPGSSPYLRRILGDLWQADLTVIERELTLATTTPGVEGRKDLATQRHTEALDAARQTGRTLAAKQLMTI